MARKKKNPPSNKSKKRTVADIEAWQSTRQLSMDSYAKEWDKRFLPVVIDYAKNDGFERGWPRPDVVAHIGAARAMLTDGAPGWSSLRELVWQRDHGVCLVCGVAITLDDYHLGHLVDRAIGGVDTPDNVVVMCEPCNMGKPLHESRAEAWEWINAQRAVGGARVGSMLSAIDRVSTGEFVIPTNVLLYHVVYANERFRHAARAIWSTVQEAQKLYPDRPRALFLDVEGHRNAAGGFDPDMHELQREFIPGCLGRFLSEIHMPLGNYTASSMQENQLPPSLVIRNH